MIEPSVQDDKVSTSVTRLDVQVSVLNKKLFYKSNKLAFAFSMNETKSVWYWNIFLESIDFEIACCRMKGKYD